MRCFALWALKFPIHFSLIACTTRPIRSSRSIPSELVFSIPELREPSRHSSGRVHLYEKGQLDEAARSAKEVLHVFQKEKILTGEYRALTLIALLSLARNSGDDAVVYLEYALEERGN